MVIFVCLRQLCINMIGRRRYLFVLGWARVGRVCLGRDSSLVFLFGGCVCSVLLLSLLERYLVTMDECMVSVLMSAVVMVFVLLFVV